MFRSAAFLAACVLVTGGLVVAADDLIGAKLATAKVEYGKAMVKAREGLVAALKEKADTAQKAGDPDVLDKVEREAKAFEVEGTLPKTVSVIDYLEAQRVARARLGVAYDTAVKDYTVAGKKDLAKATRETWTEIKNEGVAPKALPVKPRPADDGFAVGTQIKGTAVSTWGPPNKRESRENTFFFTVTKRSGNEFTLEFRGGRKVDGKIVNGMVTYRHGQDEIASFLGRFDKSKGTFTGRSVQTVNKAWIQVVKAEVVK